MRDPTWFAAFERGLANGLPDAAAVERATQELRRYLGERKEQENEDDFNESTDSSRRCRLRPVHAGEIDTRHRP